MNVLGQETGSDHRPSATLDATVPSRMLAATRSRYGGPEVLRLEELDTPTMRDEEVLIRVCASSVNPADWFMLTGTPFPVRFFAGLFRPQKPVLGMDVAGRVVAVGSKVTRFAPGDEVFGEIEGAYAEYATAHVDRLAQKPAAISMESAAVLPVAGQTPLQAFRDTARVKPGQHVLVNGASGGVGTFAVQIAKHLGAEVTGVCSTRNVELVRSLGADHVVDYTRESFTDAKGTFDVILDLVGSAPIAANRRCLRPGGLYLSSVGRSDWLWKALIASFLPGPKVVVFSARPNAEDLATLGRLVESGAVTPVIDRRHELRDVPEALRRQGEGHARGKSVVTIG